MDKERVLFIGTSSRSREMVTLLERRRYNVFHALNADEATEALQVQHFGLIVCDPSVTLNRLGWTTRPESGWLVELHDSDAEPSLVRRNNGASTEAVIAGLGNLDRVTDLLDRLLVRSGEFTRNASRDGRSPSLNLPLLDREKFSIQMSNDPTMMEEIINLYIPETGRQLRDLEAFVRQQDIPASCGLAHTLKGSFSAVFATRAGALAREVENAMRAGDFPLALTLLEPLQESAAGAETQLLEFLPAR